VGVVAVLLNELLEEPRCHQGHSVLGLGIRVARWTWVLYPELEYRTNASPVRLGILVVRTPVAGAGVVARSRPLVREWEGAKCDVRVAGPYTWASRLRMFTPDVMTLTALPKKLVT
jgi:hypothetical protein